MPMREDTGPTVDPSRFRGPSEPYTGHWREFPASWPSLEQQMPAGEMRVQLADALVRLPDRKRIVITLRDVEGHTPAESAPSSTSPRRSNGYCCIVPAPLSGHD